MSLDLYFDYNASTPVDPEVAQAALAWMTTGFANPSGSHPEARRAAAAIARAREQIAHGLGARADEILFTSGGTESNNWAFQGTARDHARGGTARGHARGHLVVSAIEHKSVLAPARDLELRGFEVSWLAPAPDGAIRIEDLRAALRPDTLLVSVMLANNETGVLQPASAIGALCRERGIRFHCDAVCAVGRVPVDVDELACDLLSVSGHKLYAPKGCGVLYVRRGTALEPLVLGCGQQAGLRGGTENTPGSVALGEALERLRKGALGSAATLAPLRDALWSGIRELHSGAVRHGTAPCLPNTLSVSLPGISAVALQAELGRRGVSVSLGASAASGAPSHVLAAMGVEPELARSALRFSLGRFTSCESIDCVLSYLRDALCSPLPAGA